MKSIPTLKVCACCDAIEESLFENICLLWQVQWKSCSAISLSICLSTYLFIYLSISLALSVCLSVSLWTVTGECEDPAILLFLLLLPSPPPPPCQLG
jgi:hypothetical protein